MITRTSPFGHRGRPTPSTPSPEVVLQSRPLTMQRVPRSIRNTCYPSRPTPIRDFPREPTTLSPTPATLPTTRTNSYANKLNNLVVNYNEQRHFYNLPIPHRARPTQPENSSVTTRREPREKRNRRNATDARPRRERQKQRAPQHGENETMGDGIGR